MKKIILAIMLAVLNLNAWEVNTHRAIDRKAIEKANNLTAFLNSNNLNNINYIDEEFEGYGTTYIKYILKGEGDGISKFNGGFSEKKATPQDLLEAGTILEDAQWPNHGTFTKGEKLKAADGRFNSHFADPQDGFKKLTIGLGSELIGTDIGKPDWTDAITWATTEHNMLIINKDIK